MVNVMCSCSGPNLTFAFCNPILNLGAWVYFNCDLKSNGHELHH